MKGLEFELVPFQLEKQKWTWVSPQALQPYEGRWSHSCVQQLDRRNWVLFDKVWLWKVRSRDMELPWRPEPDLSTALPQDKEPDGSRPAWQGLLACLFLGTTVLHFAMRRKDQTKILIKQTWEWVKTKSHQTSCAVVFRAAFLQPQHSLSEQDHTDRCHSEQNRVTVSILEIQMRWS